ncbi:MAG TPA: PmoA family protein [Phycisphaerae bacterium]|nr:PmoA family protein [Phycisphaerae bacterium]
MGRVAVLAVVATLGWAVVVPAVPAPEPPAEAPRPLLIVADEWDSMDVLADSSGQVRVAAAEVPTPAAGFRWVEQPEGRLALLEGDRPVLTYNWGDQLKAGVPADRKRSCYVHPVFGLDGEELTDDFPKDHYHHRGLSWMWNRVTVGGRNVDLWTIKGIRQRFSKWLERRADAQGAVLAVENNWVMDGPPVARETVRLQVQRAEAAGRAIDVEVRLEALAGPMELRGEATKGYGGLCFRFAPREATVITTPAGREEKDSDHKRFPWADLSARFAGRSDASGAAVFIHPANPTAPNEWTLRHYGFLGPCWPAMEAATLEPGKPVTLRYRVWIHRGDAAAGEVAKAYDAYRASAAQGDAK